MDPKLLSYFTSGTDTTKTLAYIGTEIEGFFVTRERFPISAETTEKILSETWEKPDWLTVTLELGRNNLELAIAPQPGFTPLWDKIRYGLAWLYKTASRYGAYPVFIPEFYWNESLLWIQPTEKRDQLWAALDGTVALESLTRIASVQFTIDVNPRDAISVINALWKQNVHMRDFAVNNAGWQSYIRQSSAGYRIDRYGGPEGFTNLEDYVAQLSLHDVLMHQDRLVRMPPVLLPDYDIPLHLRSIWWNYRLKRYDNTLVLEIRPFSRRNDENIHKNWEWIVEAIGY